MTASAAHTVETASRPILAPQSFSVRAVAGLPMIREGDDLAGMTVENIRDGGQSLADGDIVAFSQKIVSKAEGRTVDVRTLTPGAEALRLAEVTGKDARLVELVLSQSERVVRARTNVLIVKHRLGHVMANAGIDFSNVGADSCLIALLLPERPDESAARLRNELEKRTGRQLAVIIIDSFGRAWRRGTVGAAIGVSGLPAIADLRGQADLTGRPLQVTESGIADQVAAAASLVMGEAGEGRPVAIVSGLRWDAPDAPASALLRPSAEDLFL